MTENKAPSKLAGEIREIAKYFWGGTASEKSKELLLQAWVQLRVEQIKAKQGN